MAQLPLIIGLFIVTNSFSATPVVNQPPTPTSITMTQDETKFVELANKERASRGLSQLSVDAELIEIARQHSREMADKDYFAHESPTPSLKTPLDRYLAGIGRRPSWALVGENLFYCSIVDVTRGHIALMNSEGHRANILESRYENMGVGAYVDEDGKFYVTEMFLAKTD